MDSFSVSSSVLLDSELDLVFAKFSAKSLPLALPQPTPGFCIVGVSKYLLGAGRGGGEGEKKREETPTSNTV